jgi:ketosteroid isomerase-like protein
MSEENVNVVKAFLDASMRRDEGRVAELADPDIELHGTVGGVEEGRVYRGLAEIIREYDEVDGEAWEERRIEPVGFLDADEEVVVLFHEFRRGRGSGVELETDTAAVYTVRNGRVVRIQGFLDRQQPDRQWGFRNSRFGREEAVSDHL